MIRTDAVNLTVIPGAAYRRKFPSGGSGVVILMSGVSQPGIAAISKTSGEPILSDNTPGSYPIEAFKEAISLTAGMPYRKQGPVRLQDIKAPEPVDLPAEADEEADDGYDVVVDSRDYLKVVAAYTDKNGKLSYPLINRDMIRFAHSSSKVRAMLGDRESIDDIRLYIVGTKFRNITGSRGLKDEQVLKIAELLDEVSPRGVFRELDAELRKSLNAAKKK